MFERYTEKARRVIFFARYEASQLGADFIETEHLLLAILREDKELCMRVFGSEMPFENAAESMGLNYSGKKVSTSVDLPLTKEATSVLAIAKEEAEKLHQQFVMPGHILLGIMKQPGAAAELLKKSGLDLDKVRQVVVETDAPGPHKVPVVSDANAQIVQQLRTQFELQTEGLKPEMEPAVVYRLDK